MKITLGQAAKLTGTSKTTITRAIRAGRLSATRNDDGSYAIDPAELERVYRISLKTPAPHETGRTDATVVHRATPHETPRATPVKAPPAPPQLDVESIARMAAMESEIKGLRDMVEELRQARDAWQRQAEQAQRLLAAPSPPPTTTLSPEPEQKGFFRRLFG